MINFPVLEALEVEGYSLYPGEGGAGGLHERLDQPLTLFVGANGLGKSTLLAMLFRVLTGPTDIPGAKRDSELGFANTRAQALNATERREFAARTTDGAREATASVQVRLGESSLSVVRRLSDLRLISSAVDDGPPVAEELEYQNQIEQLSNLSSFSDWILCLRFITFYRDDRQVLFWDRSAQRQLLRSLFLPATDATEWVRLERAALEADSAHRNLRTFVNSRARDLTRWTEPATNEHAALHSELIGLLDEQADAEVEQLSSLEFLSRSEEDLAVARLELLQAQLSLEASNREYEHAKMTVLARHFPSASDSALYVWTQLLGSDQCLVCGADETGLSAAIEARIEANECSICGTALPNGTLLEGDIAEARLTRTSDARLSATSAVSALELRLTEVEKHREALRTSVATFRVGNARRQSRIAHLQSMLPQDEAEYAAAQAELNSLRLRLSDADETLRVAAEAFETYVATKSNEISSNANAIRDRFLVYARSFLVDAGEFSWSPREERIGQSEYKATFPAFELQLTRNDGQSVALRTGLDDVSESQKEFIDLAFRMALIDVAGHNGRGSVAIDTPESSLDTVFSDRAAVALDAFLEQGQGNLVVVSNITGGGFLPELLRAVRQRHRSDAKVVNLFDIAKATPAVREYEPEYRAAVEELLA